MAKRLTDWDSYYRKPYRSAALSRRYTARRLRALIRRYVPSENPAIAELGGGNSAFFDMIDNELEPSYYGIVDNNALGLESLLQRIGNRSNVELIRANLLAKPELPSNLDFVYSIGLIEHFEKSETECIVQLHLSMLRPGGIALITFPTPTWLYQIARFLAEITCNWIFHDERPLVFREVRLTLSPRSTILHEETIWPIIYTQGLIIVEKHNLSEQSNLPSERA